MDPFSKKRKVDENGASAPSPPANLTSDDARKIIAPLHRDQLADIVAKAICRDELTLDAARRIADRDLSRRKLFIRGLGWETTADNLRSVFSIYGDLAEAAVILDKSTGKSKGYGFITFRHIDGALLALREPSKKIDGRVTIAQLAASGPDASPAASEVFRRKIYVGNVPEDMAPDRLLAFFGSYGEIEEGPLGFDRQLGKFKGYALFVYRSVEGAQAALADPIKSVDGNTLQCKVAADGKKGGRAGAGGLGQQQQQQQQPVGGAGGDGHGDELGMGSQSSMTTMTGSFSSQFGGPGGGLSSYGGFSGGGGMPGGGAGVGHHHHLNSPLQSSTGLGNAGLNSVGGQAPSSLGGSGVGGYVGGGLSGGPYGSSWQYPGSGGYGGLGMSSSFYRMPASSVGMPTSGFPEGGPYSSSSMYQVQHHQPAGSSGEGMYHNIPHYF